MKLLVLLCALSFSFAHANNELDQKLQSYISNFGLKPMSEPGPINKKLFMLGRDFFFEKKLSGNNNISCAECHHPMTITIDGLPLGLGEGAQGIETAPGRRQQKTGKILARNSTALFNLHSAPVMFWDGRVRFDKALGFETPSPLPAGYPAVLKNALSAQALFPMVNHEEMRGQKGTNEIANATSDQEAWELLFKRIIAIPNYKAALTELFPGEELSLAHVAAAIGHFEAQAFSAGDTNFDRYLKGDKSAMTEIQKVGMDIFFNKGKCGECHRGEHLSDFSFHNIGVPQIGPGKINGDDLGRFEQDPRPENLYAFRVPGLRNAAVTAPYMHDGAFKTLAQVIEHYDDIETSLNEYVLVNNYKNYFEKLGSARSETNEKKLAHLSSKLSRNLFFEESEEKALAEFIRGALTERRFLDAEISDDYITSLRIQLKEEGFEKLVAALPANADIFNTQYFYFDVLTDEGYRLRELEKPVKIYFTQSDKGTTLTYRKQIFKSSGSVEGVIAGATFEDEEIITLDESSAIELANANNDFFHRLYKYRNESKAEEIPAIEKAVMKSDVLAMNDLWHNLKFKNFVSLSDDMNIAMEKLFFAPTSTNTKTEYRWEETIAGQKVIAHLQKSSIRTEVGGLVSTWAVELKLSKVQKKALPQILDIWLKNLVNSGLVPKDAQGTSPSPSKLTEEILKEIL